MKPVVKPKVRTRKCKGCGITMIKKPNKSWSEFKRSIYHNRECQMRSCKKFGGYGYGTLEEV